MKKTILILILILAFLIVGIGAFALGRVTALMGLGSSHTDYFVIKNVSPSSGRLTLKSVETHPDYDSYYYDYVLEAAELPVTHNDVSIDLGALDRGDVITVTFTGEMNKENSEYLQNAKSIELFLTTEDLVYEYRRYAVVAGISDSSIYIVSDHLYIDEDVFVTWRGEEIALSDIQVGDFIAFDYDGWTLETYPGQIHGVYSVELLEPALSPKPEKINGILQSIDGNAITVTEENTDVAYTFPLSEDTLMIDYMSSYCTAEDFETGDSITVHYAGDAVVLVRKNYVP